MRHRFPYIVSSVVLLTLLPLAGSGPRAVAQEMPAAPAAPAYTIPPQLGLTVQIAVAGTQVLPGTPAEKAGFRVNDRILQVDGKPVEGSTAFIKMLAELPQRQQIAVTVLRQGAEMTLRATLDDFAAPPEMGPDGKPKPRGRLGLAVDNLLMVSSLVSGGLAENAGVRRGDRIESVNDSLVKSVAEATKKLAGSVYRGRAVLRLRRDGTTVTSTLDLGAPEPYVVTAEDDRAAASHFRPLTDFYKEIAADELAGSAKYIKETELLSAKVLDFVRDVPKPGQAVYVLSSPGDHVKNGQQKGAVYVVWPDQNALSRFKVGDTLYMRASLEKINLAEAGTPLELIMHGEAAFASPGVAFNPLRPVLRVTGPTPKDAVRVPDLVKQAQTNLAELQTRLKGKSIQLEGTAHWLLRIGNNYTIFFYPDDTKMRERGVSISVVSKGDGGGALRGFKKGERIRVTARLDKAAVEVEEVNDFIDGGKKKEEKLILTFDAESFTMDEVPL